jgi:D-alanyl-D-alanine dipeptidase
MTPRVVIVLAAVAALLAAVILFVDRDPRPAGDGARVVPAFDRAAVRRVSIERAGAPAFALVAGGGGTWRTSPGAKLADESAVQDLIVAADFAERQRTADVTPEAAGLAPPAVVVKLETAGSPVALELGRPDAAGGGVFARAAGSRAIVVVPRRLLELANRPAEEFRDRRLVPLAADAVTSLAWRDGPASHRLALRDGRWVNERDEFVAAARVADSLRGLLALRVAGFGARPSRSAPKARFATTSPENSRTPALRAGAATAGGQSVTIGAGSTTVELELGAEGAVTRVSPEGRDDVAVAGDLAAAWRTLARAAARDQRLVSLPPEAIKRIQLTDGTQRLELMRSGAAGVWRFVTPKLPYDPDRDSVARWLAELGGVQVATRADGRRVRTLVVEGPHREAVAVSAPPEVFALLAPDPLRFRDRRVLSFASFDARRVRRSSGGAAEEVVSDDGNTWRATQGGTVDAAAVARAVVALSDLHVEAFTAAAPPGTPSATYEVDVRAPGDAAATRHVLELHPGRAACAGRLDREVSFVVERALCEELRSLRLTSPAAAAGADEPAPFVDLADVAPGIVIDMRYARADNFLGRPARGYRAARCLLTKPAAVALAAVQKDLAADGLGLMVYDCYRPGRAVADFVAWARDPATPERRARFYPVVPRSELFARGYIAERSGHSRGSTVDLTLVRRGRDGGVLPRSHPAAAADCRAVDGPTAPDGSLAMGTTFDCFDERSGSAASGLPADARENRERLRRAMQRRGFVPYASEWWHFTLAAEPFPNRSFDVEIQPR